MISIIIVNVWRNLPFSAVVLTAGISSVPQELLEAANLDGANWWVRWRKVIVPIIASYAFQTGVVAGSLGRGATMSLFLFPVLLVGALLLLRNLKARTID